MLATPGAALAPQFPRSHPYPLPTGTQRIAGRLLDLRSDAEVDREIAKFKPIVSEKNVWFFWDSGYAATHQVSKRTIRAWHRRFSKSGWTIRVVDRVPGSHSNVDKYVDIKDPELFPRAFTDNTIDGDYAPQHMSDLVRWPLLLQHGGVWADIGLIQIGDLDRLWNDTLGDPESPYEFLAYGLGKEPGRHIANYFMAARRGNSFFTHCHRLLLALWASDGGRINQNGMCRHGLLKEVPLIGSQHGLAEDIQRKISDYVTQVQVMNMVMGLVDAENGWSGPAYVAEHAYVMDVIEASSLYNEMTQQDGQKQFELMSTSLPQPGQSESDEQRQAREIVELTLQRSFGFKLAHGLLVDVLGVTLGALWRQQEGADMIPGTFGSWLRHAAIYCNPAQDPSPQDFTGLAPIKHGGLLVANQV